MCTRASRCAVDETDAQSGIRMAVTYLVPELVYHGKGIRLKGPDNIVAKVQPSQLRPHTSFKSQNS